MQCFLKSDLDYACTVDTVHIFTSDTTVFEETSEEIPNNDENISLKTCYNYILIY